MRSNYTVNASTQFRVLANDQIEEILGASLEILGRTGVTFHNDEALFMLKKAGCHVDGIRVRIPTGLVEWALRAAPSRVTLSNSRTWKRDVRLEGNNMYFGTGSDTPNFIDPRTGARVRTRKRDVEDMARVLDALPNMDFCMSLGLVQDTPKLSSDRHQFEAMVLNTGKPMVITAHDVRGFGDIIEMCEVVAGGADALRANPFMVLYAEPISPLQNPKDSVDKLMFAAQKGVPVVYTPAPMAGATAPVTLAGTLASGLAESLSGLVIHQLKGEGAPFIMGGVYTIMDMNTTIFSYAAPEFNLLQAALTDIAHYLKLPIFCTAGCTDSNILDEQAAIEATFSILVTALSGGNLIHDVGYLEYGSTGSIDMLVMSDEIVGMARRFVRGIRVDDETLALDVVDSVGPGGHFLGEQHTLKHLRGEFWFPTLISRARYDGWKADGGLTMGERVHRKTIKLLEGHNPEPLSPDVQKRLREIVDRADSAAVR